MFQPKKWLLLVAVALLLSSGAHVQTTRAADPVTLEWWTVDSEEETEQVQRDMAKQFEKENPDIKVNVTILPESGFTDKVTTTLGAGQGAPDVAYFWDNNWFPQALDLTPFLAADKDVKPETYIKGFFDTRARFQGKVVGLPLGVGANFVMYNKDLFDAAGVAYPTADWTTDDYLKLATKMSNPAKKQWGGDRPRGPFRAIFNNYGAFPYSEDSMKVEGYLNSPAALAAYTWLWDLVNSNSTPTPADLEVLSKEGTGPVDLFLAGRVAMATLNQGHLLNVVKSGMRFGVLPEPKGPATGRYVNSWSLTASIWKGTKHPNEAWRFLSYWVGPKGQKFMMDNGNLIPSIPTVLTSYKDADKDYAKSFFEVLNLTPVAQWDATRPCKATVLRAAQDVWDLINLGKIKREEIKAKLDSLVAPAQKALDDCRARLGG